MTLQNILKSNVTTLITLFMIIISTHSYANQTDTEALVNWHSDSECNAGKFYDEATYDQCFAVVKNYYLLQVQGHYSKFNYIKVHERCTSAELKRQDHTLNRLYKELMSNADNQLTNDLRSAQRQWLKYRDAHCDFIENVSAPSNTVAKSTCLFNATNIRNKELDTIATYLITER